MKKSALSQNTLRIADLFCGAGGTSSGAVEAIELLGHKAELTAINHWDTAISTHSVNHPNARHFCTSVDDIDPQKLFKEGELDILWASPACQHHSIARGGKPVNDQSRATGWCVVRWAESLRPNVILVENVPEFLSWGPLGANGKPLQSRKGEMFRAWVAALEACGYRSAHRILCAADYGDPTTRQRLFVQFVRGKRKIVWPDATHSKAPTDELFGPKRLPWRTARDHVIDWSIAGKSIYERKRPLSAKTIRRIMSGLEKFGLKIIPRNPADETEAVSSELRAESMIITMEHGGSLRRSDLPLPTITTAKGGAMGVAQPFLIPQQSGENRVRSVDIPLQTVTTESCGIGLIQPFLVSAQGGIEPALLPQQSAGVLRPVSQPSPTVSTAGAIGLIEPFLIQYYGTGHADSVNDPLASVTTKERHALIHPEVVIDGQRYRLDIRFRMLQPHELAAAQGFRSSYQFTGTKTEQVKQIGNAVPRNLARALVLAALTQQSDITSHVNTATSATHGIAAA